MSFKNLNFAVIIAPIIAIFFAMFANGYLTTFVSIRLYAMGGNEWIIGNISAGYYIGIALGAFTCERFTLRVGHIRAYSTFATIAAIATLLCGLIPNLKLWFLFRFITGYCIAGIWVVIESWFLNISNSSNRGKYLAIYMFTIYSANTLGQILLKFSDEYYLKDFVIIAIFTSASIIPIAINSVNAPQIDQPNFVSIKKLFKISPSGIMACFVAGILLAVLYSLLPYFYELQNINKSRIALLMAITILGGTLLQFPIGYVSDIIDRRKVLIFVSGVLTIVSILIFFVDVNSNIFLPLMFIFGGVIFAINPLGMSHVCDYIKNENIVSVTQGLVLVYGIGNILGPFISPIFLSIFGPYGLFIFFASIGVIFFIFLIYRINLIDRNPEKFKQDFVVSSTTSPIASVLDPRADENNIK